MKLYEIFKLISLFGGLALHTLLLMQSVRWKRRRLVGILFFFLLLSSGIWFLGLFANYFLELLFGQNNVSVLWITTSFSLFLITGLALAPSLLLHTLVVFFLEKELNFNEKLKPWVERGIYSIYFPLLFLPLVFYQLFQNSSVPYEKVLEPYFFPFCFWLLAVSVSASLLCLKISRVGWETEERHLFFTLSVTFLLDAFLIGFFVYFRMFSPHVWTDPLKLVGSLLPTVVFAYYVYRYNYMDYVIRRDFLYSILIIAIVLLYLNGVERLTQYVEQRYEVDASLLRSLFVLALVLAFRPFRTHAAEMLDRFFFKEREVYKKVYRELTQRIRGGNVRNLPALMCHIVQVLKKTLDLEHASLVFFKKDKEGQKILASTLPFKMEDFKHILRYLDTHKWKVLHRHDIDDEEVLREMDVLGAVTIIPIYSEGELIGLFPLGKKQNKRKLHSEEVEMLVLLSNQLATEIQNMQLLEEKLQLERELLQNEKFMALGRLSASVAHQVKNPLSSIKILAQVMKEDLPPEDPREEDLSLIIQEVDKLTRVVNQLLDFARPAQQDSQIADLDQVIDEVVMLMQHEANRYNVKIRKEFPLSLPPVRADRLTLQDIFSNLIQNSIHAMARKGGEVVIKAFVPALPSPEEDFEFDPEEMVTVEIRDKGVGIPQENLKNIFEPFFTTKPQGTGLGLPIVKQRLENIGGTIHVVSPPRGEKEGTSVFVWLPLVR